MYDNLKFNNERLKKVLREKNLTRTEAAGQIGISNDAFTNYRKGRLPKTGFLYAIAQFFDKPMEWFLTEEGEPEDMLAAYEEPSDEDLDDLTLEEMCEILTKLMSSSNSNIRGWTVMQFRDAFNKYCRKKPGVKEAFARYTADKKNMQ